HFAETSARTDRARDPCALRRPSRAGGPAQPGPRPAVVVTRGKPRERSASAAHCLRGQGRDQNRPRRRPLASRAAASITGILITAILSLTLALYGDHGAIFSLAR